MDTLQDSDSEPAQKWKQYVEPQQKLPLFMVDFNQCDGKKCTGRKMERFKMLSTIKDKKRFKGVVLSAFGKKTISKQDVPYCEKYGLCVIDCSWNRVDETKEFRYKHERRLPYVVAGNPVNYGKPYQLSCVQALATGLCSMGYLQQAQFIMSKFGWADGFWSINKGIELYADCTDMEAVMVQSKLNEQRVDQGFQRDYDVPDSSNSDQAE